MSQQFIPVSIMAEYFHAPFNPPAHHDNPYETKPDAEAGNWTGVLPEEKRQGDSSAARPEPLTPSKLASIGEPETKLEETDNSITLLLGWMLQKPGMEEHTDKLVLCSKLNQLRRPATTSSLAQDCIAMRLSDAEWGQLEAALNSSPRVLNILQAFTEQDEPILRDTIRFRRGLALLNENIEVLPEGKIKEDLKLVWAQLADVTYPTRMTSVFCTRGG